MTTTAETNTATLFERLGGAAAIAAAVEGLYERVLADAELAPFFESANFKTQRGRLAKFVAGATGGPPYRGRSMTDAHAHLRIEQRHFDAVVTYLVEQLSAMSVDALLIVELVNALAPLADEIITVTETPAGVQPERTTTAMTTQSAVLDEQSTIDAAFFASMCENIPLNIMYVDLDLVLRYMNKASTDTLRTLEAHLPVRAYEMIGKVIDIFHKNPDHQRRMLADASNLPHNALIQVGLETLDLLVTAVYDAAGERVGSMASWSVVT